MSRPDNYRIQLQQAQQRFLTYDQDALIQKQKLKADPDYLYATMLSRQYRISRTTGTLESLVCGSWSDANSFAEVMILLDFLCDSAEIRYLSGQWKNMRDFGLMFHQNLLENAHDPWAELFGSNPDAFCRACEALGGTPLAMGDISYGIELFDGLTIAVQLWFGDEEFPANLRFLWDENATMYIRYETMHYARGLLLNRIRDSM